MRSSRCAVGPQKSVVNIGVAPRERPRYLPDWTIDDATYIRGAGRHEGAPACRPFSASYWKS